MGLMEIWKTIPGIETFEVSSLGRVRRSQHSAPAIHTFPGKLLKPDVSTGYERVSLRHNGKLHRACVHRLVGRAFLGPAREFAHINHKDGNKRNNKVENLEWCSAQENVGHAWATGLCQPALGIKHGMSKLQDRDIEVIRNARSRGVKLKEIAAVFEITEAMVSQIALNKNWKHLKPNP